MTYCSATWPPAPRAPHTLSGTIKWLCCLWDKANTRLSECIGSMTKRHQPLRTICYLVEPEGDPCQDVEPLESLRHWRVGGPKWKANPSAPLDPGSSWLITLLNLPMERWHLLSWKGWDQIRCFLPKHHIYTQSPTEFEEPPGREEDGTWLLKGLVVNISPHHWKR